MTTYGDDRVGDVDAGQRLVVIGKISRYPLHTASKIDSGHILVEWRIRTCEIRTIDGIEIKGSQIATTTKSIVADGCNRFGNGDTGQTAAAIERLISDGCNGVGDVYACQALAVIERLVTYGSDGVWDGHAG